MELVKSILELSLAISTLAFIVLLIYSMLYRDGMIWNIWRWNVVFSLLGSFSAMMLVRNIDYIVFQRNWIVIMFVATSSFARIGSAITSFVIAMHLKNSQNNATN